MEIVANSLKVNKQIFREPYRNGIMRGIAAEMLYRYNGLKQAEIGKLLGGIDYSAVNRLRNRLRKKMKKEHKIKEPFEKVEIKVRDKLSNVEI